MDTKKLTNALSKYATGITVITTSDKQGNPFGVTVNSFTSVSLEPPLVLWCLGDQTFGLDVFVNANHFVVNILSSQQQRVSNNFSTPGDFDRFASVSYQKSNSGIPMISDCLANLECVHHKTDRVGDHWVFICKVEEVVIIDGKPLIYYESRYSHLR